MAKTAYNICPNLYKATFQFSFFDENFWTDLCTEWKMDRHTTNSASGGTTQVALTQMMQTPWIHQTSISENSASIAFDEPRIFGHLSKCLTQTIVIGPLSH